MSLTFLRSGTVPHSGPSTLGPPPTGEEEDEAEGEVDTLVDGIQMLGNDEGRRKKVLGGGGGLASKDPFSYYSYLISILSSPLCSALLSLLLLSRNHAGDGERKRERERRGRNLGMKKKKEKKRDLISSEETASPFLSGREQRG